MAITTLDGYIAAASQRVSILKTAAITSVAAMPTQIIQAAGNPGAGTLAGTSTAAGVVPVAGNVGFPGINSFGGLTGYISKIEFNGSVAGRLVLYDCLWKAGAYNFNSNVTLAAQPSYAGRVLGGTDFTNTELWVEAVTAGTGVQNVTITYTNHAGTAAKSTGTVAAPAALAVARMFQVPLATGDTGLQKVESIVGSVATVGTFNVLVMRRLWSGRVNLANSGDIHDILKTGMPQIFDTSALMLIAVPDSTSTGTPEIVCEVVSG